jgi:hypothetical protein
MEQLAHRGAYGKLDPRKLAAWGYREAGVAEEITASLTRHRRAE